MNAFSQLFSTGSPYNPATLEMVWMRFKIKVNKNFNSVFKYISSQKYWVFFIISSKARFFAITSNGTENMRHTSSKAKDTYFAPYIPKMYQKNP